MQLLSCLSKELESNAAVLNITTMAEAEILQAVKTLAVAPVSISRRRTEVMGAQQQHGEQFRIYVCRVRKLATDCKFLMPCNNARATGGFCANVLCCGTHGKQDYADEIIKNVVLNGIYNHKIKRLVLAADGLYDKDIEIIKNVKLHKRAFLSTSASSPTVAAATAYKAQGKTLLGGGRPGGGGRAGTKAGPATGVLAEEGLRWSGRVSHPPDRYSPDQ